MGEVLNLTCSFGNDAQDLQGELAVCSHCGEMVLATGGLESVLLDTPCPRCGQEAMRVSEIGIWD